MSTVDKMLIKGIRSFDPENKNVITFYKPLTLIVGPNGAGKTTVIECLKVACSGELPPNARSGQSFIHDPKVAGETETKGQIKLRFKTAAGKDVVCIRSYQLTQKASKMEYKALESVLQTINPHTGEKVCLSYRCADMDREIPALMGVSKAILENVIFVHQDEANWPLQDPSTLKKKFDDIFTATRYTKALEVIKKLHKDQAQEIKTYKLKLENLQILKNDACKLRESITSDQHTIEALNRQMLELDNDIDIVNSNIHNTEITLKDLRKLKEQIATKTAERSTYLNEQQRQYNALEEENEDTDEELMEWKTKFQQRIEMLETKCHKLQREMEDMETNISSLNQTTAEYLKEISRLETEADGHLSRKNERDLKIQRLFESHNLGVVPNGPFSDEVAMNLTNRIVSRLKELEKDLADKKKANETKLKATWDQYIHAKDRGRDIEFQKEAKANRKGVILKQMEEKKNARDSLELQISNVNLSLLDEREKSLCIEVERKTKQLAEREFESIIQKKQSEMYSLEQKITVLKREKSIIAADSEVRKEFSLKKAELENLKKKHKKIINDYKDKIRGILKGRLPSDKDLKKEVSKVQRVTEAEFDEMNLKAREAEKEVNTLQMKIQEVNTNLSKLHKDLESRRKFVESNLQSWDQQSVGIDSYPEALDTSKKRRDDLTSQYNMSAGMRQMFDPFEKVAREYHFCPCCERPFSAEEEDDFVRKQRVKSATSAEQLKLLGRDTSTAESKFHQLDKLRTVYEEYVKIGQESIPQAEKCVTELNEELEQKNQALDDILGVLAQVKAEKGAVDALIQPVETADRLFQEIQEVQKQVEDLEYKLDFRGQGVKTMEDIQSELDSLQRTKDGLHNDLGQLREDHQFMEKDLSVLQIRWHTQREEKLKAVNMLQTFRKIEEELDQLAEEKSQLELDEKHLAEALGPLLEEREKFLREHEDLKVKLDQEYVELTELKQNYKLELDKLLEISSDIKKYNDLKRGERLKDLQEKQIQAKAQLHSFERRKGEIIGELNKSQELKNNQDKLRRNIEDNLNYRMMKSKVDALGREIDELEDQVLKLGGFSSIDAELAKLTREKERLLSELNRQRGTVSVHNSNISKNMITLKESQYKDIDKRYFDQLVQLKTTEMANKDLDRYYSALDKALMRFHTMKMEEINKIIRELWQQTYRGQDIDYISIHSDSEGAGTRSYSYKVLMQTGNAELEMRGRCSAGQKVLASLIIRLALAETFCLNCGILALDEPTTNLDGPNSESLAAALLKIMEDRKGQENFQLIVITHDERFAQLIGQRQHAEKYYRVSKDDHQHSIIEAQEIFD
ncbi:OLC1v1018973C1 [Oldenlandia corymbosa var. corymbosa]|uniref:DNA repair protein RAD50 n=1 Tax=Oldenlandia corymbosa var. corymbosa TaxID=529605 RepID=A0AAV1ECY5_OLDCO|nr:OLC1v1018973C1 [Oldenlandia corymbosa var. corymbosa]